MREFSGILLKTVDRLELTVTELRRENRELAGLEVPGELAQAWLATELKDQLTRLQKKFFGFGRETLPGKPARPVGHKGQEVLALTARPQEKTEPAPKAGTPSASALGSETESKSHDFSSPDLVAESLTRGFAMSVGAEAWKKITGLTEDTVEITIAERTYRKVIHKQSKYRLKDEYNDSDKEVIITAPGPVKVKKGMTYSVDFALAVASDKYEYHRVPRALRKDRKHEVGQTFLKVRNYAEDGGRSSGVVLQGKTSNCPELRWSKASVVSVVGKVAA